MTVSWTLPRLSTEWVGPIVVSRDGAPVTGWTYALLPFGERPATTGAIDGSPDPLDGGLGILVGPGTDHVLAAGVYRIWVRYVDDPEAPVLDDVGRIHIT